jgi:lysophospholipase L1-like esterase
MGEVMGSLPADLITLKLGINVYGLGSLSIRSYRPSVLNLIRTIRRFHPIAPIGVITPIFCGPREPTAGKSGMTLENYREENREVVSILKELGDGNLHAYEGHDILGPDRADYLPDDLHPNGLGYQLLGESVSQIIIQDMLSKVK